MRRRVPDRKVYWGRDRLPPGFSLHRHQHKEGYANVILSGSFTEASFSGVAYVEPGDALIHGSLDRHCNHSSSKRGLTIIRLPWFGEGNDGRFFLDDPDEVARLAARCPFEAADYVAQNMRPRSAPEADWPARLAHDLIADQGLVLRTWARVNGLTAETLSRGFLQMFGTTPNQYRLEVRTRAAWNTIRGTSRSLTEIALAHGFYDLSHMNRCMKFFTGRPPHQWRTAGSA